MNNTAKRSGSRRIPLWVFAAIAGVSFGADLVTKQWALSTLKPGEFTPVFGRFFGFELVFNPGAAFSFLTGATWVFTIIALGVAGAIVWVQPRVRSWWWIVSLSMLLGGTLGNLFDRVFREPGIGVGHVVDFLNYNGYFVGNVADIFIVISAVGIAILAFLGKPLDATSVESDAADG